MGLSKLHKNNKNQNLERFGFNYERGAGVLRDKPKSLHWEKDRGSDVASAPWYELGPAYGGKKGDRINDHHLSLADKRKAREKTK